MNRVIITGNLGQKPEVRETKSGMPITNLRVATNERVKNGDNWGDHTEWHSVVVFGKQAENCERFLDKGSKVLVEGKIRTREYEDKLGVQRKSTEIDANNVEFLTRAENGMGDAQPAKALTNAASRTSAPSESDEDIPF